MYLISNTDDYETVYKIGFTRKKPMNRLKQLQTGSKGDLKLIHTFETDYGAKLENALHKIYQPYRVRNEWFEISAEKVDEFLFYCNKLENNFNFLKDNKNPFFEKWIKK